MGRLAAGVVNGVQAALAGTGSGGEEPIILQLENGAEVARWLLPDLRRAARQNPEVTYRA